LRIKDQTLHLNPHCPEQWEGYGFQILLNAEPVKIEVTKEGHQITNLGPNDITVILGDSRTPLSLKAGETQFTAKAS
jgi:trehalose/maltose hydrolase-like predicted phosphorylase